MYLYRYSIEIVQITCNAKEGEARANEYDFKQ